MALTVLCVPSSLDSGPAPTPVALCKVTPAALCKVTLVALCKVTSTALCKVTHVADR